MNNKEKIETKIMMLTTSVKRITAISETLQELIPTSTIEDTLKILFVANLLKQQTFEVFYKLDTQAEAHAKTIYP